MRNVSFWKTLSLRLYMAGILLRMAVLAIFKPLHADAHMIAFASAYLTARGILPQGYTKQPTHMPPHWLQ